MPRRQLDKATLRKHIKLLSHKLFKTIVLDLRGQLPKGEYEYSSGSFDLTVYPVRHKRLIKLSMIEGDGTVKETIVYGSGRMKSVKDINELKEIRAELGYMLDNAHTISSELIRYNKEQEPEIREQEAYA